MCVLRLIKLKVWCMNLHYECIKLLSDSFVHRYLAPRNDASRLVNSSVVAHSYWLTTRNLTHSRCSPVCRVWARIENFAFIPSSELQIGALTEIRTTILTFHTRLWLLYLIFRHSLNLMLSLLQCLSLQGELRKYF